MDLYNQALRRLHESGAVAHQLLANNHHRISQFESLCGALVERGITFHPYVLAEVSGPIFGISLMRHDEECADRLIALLREMGAGLVHKGTTHRVSIFRVSLNGVPAFTLSVHVGSVQPSARQEAAR